jgi:ribose transport system permease protein
MMVTNSGLIGIKEFGKKIVFNRSFIAIIAIAMLFLFGQIIFPGFISFSHLMNILRLSVFLGIVALAQTLVILSGKEGIDLSVGAVLSIGVVLSAKIMDGNNSNIAIAFVIVLLVGFAIGLINGAGVSYIGIPPLITTLAMASVIEGLSLILTKGFPTGSASPFLETVGNGRILNIPYLVILWIGLLIAVSFLLKKTRWGRILYGIGENDTTAHLCGINVKLFRMFVYAISGGIACVGGMLLLSYTGTPYLNLGAPYLMPSIAAVAIGGVALSGGNGTYLGSVLGCIFLTTLSSILVALQTTEAIRQIVYGALLFFLVIAYTQKRT